MLVFHFFHASKTFFNFDYNKLEKILFAYLLLQSKKIIPPVARERIFWKKLPCRFLTQFEISNVSFSIFFEVQKLFFRSDSEQLEVYFLWRKYANFEEINLPIFTQTEISNVSFSRFLYFRDLFFKFDSGHL